MKGLLLVIVLSLNACAGREVKAPEPEPPRIDCSERAPVEPLPRKPQTTSWKRWKAYSLRLLGVIEAEVGKRAEVADCLDRERAAGRIR